MAGTREGGLKAAAKNREKNPNFYQEIGRKGGKNGHTGGFAYDPEKAKIAGHKGGMISSRAKKKPSLKKRRAMYKLGEFLGVN